MILDDFNGRSPISTHIVSFRYFLLPLPITTRKVLQGGDDCWQRDRKHALLWRSAKKRSGSSVERQKNKRGEINKKMVSCLSWVQRLQIQVTMRKSINACQKNVATSSRNGSAWGVPHPHESQRKKNCRGYLYSRLAHQRYYCRKTVHNSRNCPAAWSLFQYSATILVWAADGLRS